MHFVDRFRCSFTPSRVRTALCFVALLTIVVVYSTPRCAFAQSTSTTPTTESAEDQPPVDATSQARPTERNLSDRKSLRALKEEFANATHLEESLRKRVVEAYTAALGHWDVLEAARRKSRRYAKELQTAPQRIAAAREQLDALPDEPQIEVSPDAPLETLEQALTTAKVRLATARNEAEAAEKASRQLTSRRSETTRDTAETQKQIEKLETALAEEISDLPPQLAAARKAANLLAQKAAREHINALNQELLLLGAEEPLYTLNKDLTARRLALAEQHVQTLETWANERRLKKAELEAREAERILRSFADADPVLRTLAEQNTDLTEQSSKLTDRIKRIAGQIQASEETLQRLNESYRSVTGRLQHVGMTEAIGVLLQKERLLLPPADVLHRECNTLQKRLTTLQVNLMDLDSERADLTEIGPEVERIIERIERSQPAPLETGQRESLRRNTRELLEKRRSYLDGLIQNHRSLIDDLTRLHTLKQQVMDRSRQFAEFIDERILWIRSAGPIPQGLDRSFEAGAWLLAPSHWIEAGDTLRRDVGASPLPWITVAGGLTLLLMLPRRLRDRLVQLGRLRESTFLQAARIFLAATGISILLAAPVPLALWAVSWRLRMSEAATEFTAAAGAGLYALALLAATVCLLRQILRPGGMGDVNLHLPREPMGPFRQSLLTVSWIVAPLLWITVALEHAPRQDFADSLGRLALMALMVVLSALLLRWMRPANPTLLRALGRGGGLVASRYRSFVYPPLVVAPLVLAGLAGMGYIYTATHLAARLGRTFWMLMGLALLNTAALHWLAVAARQILLQRRRQQDEASGELDSGETAKDATGETVSLELFELDFSQISEQSRQFLRFVMILLLVVGTWTIWADTLPALHWLDRVELWDVQREVRPDANEVSLPLPGSPLGSEQASDQPAAEGSAADGGARLATVPVTLTDVGLALLVVVLAVSLARSVPGVLEMTLLPRLGIDPGGRYAILAIFRYVLGATAVVVALGLLGVNWTNVQWLVAAMTFGLAFGLQEIFANFIAGIILLFERPIRLGDTVSIGETTGTVSNIRIRATTITDWDRKELIVPNKEFVTNRLINWTLSDNILRLIVPVGAAYGSDTEKVIQTLRRIAEENPRVLAEPAPIVLFNGFGDNALQFELRVYIGSIEHYLRTIHEVHVAVDRAFRESGITIAFPQRDVHFDPKTPLEVKLVRQGQAKTDG
jgi:potassium-dependent mechanosensitive channel